MSSFQVSIDFWATSEGLHASDSLSFSNFGIIETHEGESVNFIELKGYLHVMVFPKLGYIKLWFCCNLYVSSCNFAITRAHQTVVLP